MDLPVMPYTCTGWRLSFDLERWVSWFNPCRGRSDKGISTHHLLKEVPGWWAGCNRHLDWVWQSLGFFGGYQQGVDSRGGVEVRNLLLLEELPDEGVVNLSQTHVEPPDGHNGPGECPSYGVEPGRRVSGNYRRLRRSKRTYMGSVHRYRHWPALRLDSITLARAAR